MGVEVKIGRAVPAGVEASAVGGHPGRLRFKGLCCRVKQPCCSKMAGSLHCNFFLDSGCNDVDERTGARDGDKTHKGWCKPVKLSEGSPMPGK